MSEIATAPVTAPAPVGNLAATPAPAPTTTTAATEPVVRQSGESLNDVAARIAQKTAAPATPTPTPTPAQTQTDPASPAAPVADPAAPTTATTPATAEPANPFDALDTFEDPPLVTPEQPVQTKAPEPAAPPTPSIPEVSLEAELAALPDTLKNDPVAAKAIETYLKTKTSTEVRQLARVTREIAKPVEKGGLGYVPQPDEIISAFQGADATRAFFDDFHSASENPQAADRWTKFWLYQQVPDPNTGRPVIAMDPETRQPVLRPGADAILSRLVENAIHSPNAAEILSDKLVKSLQDAVTRNPNHPSFKSLVNLGNTFFNHFLTNARAALPQIQGTVVPFKDAAGKEIQVPGDQVLSTFIAYMENELNLTPTKLSPEAEQLQLQERQRREQAVKQQREQSQTQYKQRLTVVNNSIGQAIESDLSLLDASEVLKDAPDLGYLKNGLRQSIQAAIMQSPAYKQAWGRMEKDLRAGTDPRQAAFPVIRAAREAYRQMLKTEGSKIVQSRMATVGTKTQAVAQQLQTQAVGAETPAAASGTPVAATSAPIARNPGETMRDYLDRVFAARGLS